MNFNYDTGLIDTILTLDTTETPAKGGNVNSLVIIGTGALALPAGTTAQEPSGSNVQAGMIRWNTSVPQLEYYNGSVWLSFTAGTGSVTSVNASGGSTGFSFSGGPITTSGTLTMSGTLAVTNGGTGLSAGPTANGQVLIGSSTGSYTLSTLTAGTGVSVTNGAGSITVANTGVTSFVTTLSGLTPSTAATGAVTLAGTLGVTSGGTGNSTAPTNGQIPVGNSSGGFSYTTITAGTAIGVANGSGSITINNTGVTSLAGTDNEILVSASTGAITLSLPSGGITVASLTDSGLTADSFVYPTTGGLLASTAAATNGQILIGSTGNVPVAATITAGTGVSVTNGAGSITVANTGVTSFSAGTTGFTPSTATTGAVTLSGSLNPANGGTGLTSTPTSGQLPIGNNSSGFTLATLTAGTGISVVNGSGTITINNTGVTSVAATTSSTGLSISGSPITTTGTLTFTLSSALQALATLGAGATTGLITQSGVNTFSDVTITGTTNNIVVTNGNGVGGNPTINLASVTQSTGSNFDKITVDGYGRVTGTTAVAQSDLTSLIGTYYLPEAGGTMSGAINMGANQINNLAMASIPASTDAVNVAYLQAQIAGLSWKQEVAAATTANITLSGLQTIDGYTTVVGDRILVKNQTDPTQNGIYIVSSGSWTRSTDAATGPELQGAAVYVNQGTTNANTGWTQTTTGTITIGTTPIVWAQFSGSGAYSAGTGLTLTGNTFALSTPVSVTNGGTGVTTTPTNGELLIGNGSGYTAATLTAGTGVSVTNGAGTITVANTGVTSITGTTNQIVASASTGAVTLSLPSTVIVSNLDVSSLTQNGVLYAGASGAITSTAAPTNGQLLIGYTGQNPVLATLTAGTGVSVTNGNGSITIANTGVTSFSAGTTGFTPTTATTGAVTLAGSLNPANGGTGLSSAPTAGQIAVGTSGGGYALTTITAGTGISVTNGSGSITVANTGVTSVALSTPGVIFSVSGSPVTTTGTLALNLLTQTANTILAGPTSGSAATPTFRSLVAADVIGTALKLYNENPSSPTAPTVAGTNAVAIGSGSSASATNSLAFGTTSTASATGAVAIGVGATAGAVNSIAIGSGSNTYLQGGEAFASGDFTSAGDAQAGKYVLRNITTNATQTQLYLDGSAQLLILPNNSMWTFDILIAARRTDTTGTAGSWRFVGGIKKDATAASTTLVGLTSETVIGVVGSSLTVAVIADTANGSLDVEVTGVAGNTVRWVAVVNTVEIHQ